MNKLKHLENRAKFHLQQANISLLIRRAIKIIYLNLVREPLQTLIHTIRGFLVIDTKELRETYAEEVWEMEEEVEISQKSVNKTIINKENTTSFQTWHNEIQEPFVAKVNNCYITGNNSLSFKEGKVLEDTFTHWNGENREFSKVMTGQIISSPVKSLKLLSRASKNEFTSVERAMVMNNSTSTYYYHWLLDHLPKLRGLEKYEEKTGNPAKLIIPQDAPKFVKESLEIFAPEKEVIEAGSEVKHVENLITPSFPQTTPNTLNWIKNKGLESKKENVTPKSSRIYISRQKTDKRKVENFEEIKPILDNFQIKDISLEEHSFQEQISLINNADVIVAPHGGGLANIIWGDDLTVIELFNQHTNDLYPVLAEVMGHEYAYLINSSIGNERKEKDRDLLVDTERLEDILEDKLTL